jgi:hypothetical protein
MATLKLSQITSGNAIVPSTDQLVGVRSGTTDVLLNPGQFTILSLGATPTDAIFCQNTTPAISGTQQVSPAIEQSGQGWATGSGGSSQAVNFRSYVQPVQGVTNPTGNLTWQSNVNGGSYSTILNLTTAGVLYGGSSGLFLGNYQQITFSSSVSGSAPEWVFYTSYGHLQRAGYQVAWSSSSAITSSANADTGLTRVAAGVVGATNGSTGLGVFRGGGATAEGASPTDRLQLYNTTAAANGAQQYSPLTHHQAQGFGTTAGTSQSIDFTQGVTATQGTVPTGAMVWQAQVAGAGYTTVLAVGTGVQGITALAGVNTAGKGVPAIYASARTATQTNTTATITSYANPAADGSFEVTAYVNVSAATAASMTVTCTFTDETNTSRTATFSFVQNGVAVPIQTITNATGAGAYLGMTMRIRAKASTTITVATAGTVSGITYIAESDIKQVA